MGRCISVIMISWMMVVLSSSPLLAQRRQIGFTGLLGFPQGAFKERAGNLGGGLSASLDFALVSSLVLVGVEVGYWAYGSEKRRERGYDVTTTNSMVPVHLLLRLQPRQGAVRPYLDGLIGFHYLFTDTSSKCYFDPTQPEETRISCYIPYHLRNFSDYALSYGGGSGLMIRVHEHEKKDSDQELGVLLLDLRVRYLFGSNAQYLKKGSIHQQNGTVVYDINASRTNVLAIYIGVVIEFREL